MNTALPRLSLSLLLASCCFLPSVSSADSGLVDQLIIKYKPSVQARSDGRSIRARAVASVSASTGLAVRYKRAMARSTSAHVLKLPYEMSVEEARTYAEQVMQDSPGIEYAEPDYRRYPRLTPNDTQQSQQWAIQDVTTFAGASNLYKAWDLTTGSGAVAAVLDSGYRPHADLVDNVLGQYDFVTDDEAGDGDSRDGDASDPGVPEDSAEDASWHGTHVAGIVAAKGNNNLGVAGTAYDASLLMVRILGAEGGSMSDQVDGMLWAAGESVPGVPDNPNPANVINLSVGTDDFQECGNTEQAAVQTLRTKGVITVVSAGNENRNTEGSAPANCAGVIAVAGLATDGARASFSNYGPINDIAAPATQIMSTYNTGTREPGSDEYDKQDGTSQAAPRVTGVISLMFAANPGFKDGSVAQNTVADLIENKIKQSARPFPTSIAGSDSPTGCNGNSDINCVCTTSMCGAGMLDAYQAVLSVSTKPTAEAGSAQSVASGATVTLNGSGSTDDAYNKDSSGNPVLSYAWSQTGGASVSLSDASQVSPAFSAPSVNTATPLTFQLVVTDDTGLVSTADTVVVTVGDGGDNGNGATAANQLQVQQVYIAYYGRAADPGGLDYWAGELAGNGGDLTGIINQFGNSDEYTGRFGSLDNQTLVNNIYQNLFNRDSDSAGLAFYTGRLTNGEATLAEIALQILDGAINEDKTIVDNKQEVAAYLTEQVRGNSSIYNSSSIARVVAIMSAVTENSDTVATAKAQIDNWING